MKVSRWRSRFWLAIKNSERLGKRRVRAGWIELAGSLSEFGRHRAINRFVTLVPSDNSQEFLTRGGKTSHRYSSHSGRKKRGSARLASRAERFSHAGRLGGTKTAASPYRSYRFAMGQLGGGGGDAAAQISRCPDVIFQSQLPQKENLRRATDERLEKHPG